MTRLAHNELFSMAQPLVLASASPRRREFLDGLGIQYQAYPAPEETEPTPFAGEDPAAYAQRAATTKAHAVLERLRRDSPLSPPPAVLSADTVVALGQRVLGKPVDTAEALEFLQALAGKNHMVFTACCLSMHGAPDRYVVGSAEVCMASWPTAVLAAYAASGEGRDKAGGYAVQGRGAFLVQSVRGSWSAVVGLPLTETVRMLWDAGVLTAPVL